MDDLRKISILCLVGMIFILPAIACAATPKEYRERVESARFSVEELLENVQADDRSSDAELLAEIETEVPGSEPIEWPGGSVMTDNSWLASSLKRFTESTVKADRARILIETSERLLAISERAKELEKMSAGTASKDQDKQKLADILNREEYQKPLPKEESLFQKWWREFMDWLRRVFPSGPEMTPSASGLGSLQFVLQILIFAAVTGLIGFLIYRFAPFLRNRRRKRAKDDKGERVIMGERIGDDESSTDLFAGAEQLARSGDLRGAIRKGYIALLCDLSDRRIVRLARHKTNRDYLRDVRSERELFESVRGLTLSFENNWYGLRAAESSDWEDFRARYMQALLDARRAAR